MLEKIEEAKIKNWANLVSARVDLLCKIRKNDTDIFIQILTGKIFEFEEKRW